jgi:hypothetical protein
MDKTRTQHEASLAACAGARIILRLTATGRLAKALSHLVLCYFGHGNALGRLEGADKLLRSIDASWRDADTHEALRAIGGAIHLEKAQAEPAPFDVKSFQDLPLDWAGQTFEQVQESREVERRLAEDAGLLGYAREDARLAAEVTASAVEREAHLSMAEEHLDKAQIAHPKERSRHGRDALRAVIRALRVGTPFAVLLLALACSDAAATREPANTCARIGVVNDSSVWVCEGAGLRCAAMTAGYESSGSGGKSVALSCVAAKESK